MAALTLNGPVEVGVRTLMILVESYPEARTLDHLVLLDHGTLHSGDWGGPESLHPPLPLRAGELAMRRDAILAGLHLMMRVNLIEAKPLDQGIGFRAKDAARHFVDVLVSNYSRALRNTSRWSVAQFGPMPLEQQSAALQNLLSAWSEDHGAIKNSSGEQEKR